MTSVESYEFEDFEPTELSAPHSQPQLKSLPGSSRIGRPPITEQSIAPSFTFSTTTTATTTAAVGQRYPRHTDPYLFFTEGDRAAAPPPFSTDSILGKARSDASFSDRFSAVLSAPLPNSLRGDSPRDSKRRASPLGLGHMSTIATTTPWSGVQSSSELSQQQEDDRGTYSRRVSPSSSPNVSIRKPSSVHDVLHQEGKIIQQYKEALREEAVRRELATLRSPKISRFAREKEEEAQRRRKDGERRDVVERMEERVRRAREKKESRAQEIKAQQERKEIEQLLVDDDDDSFAESLDYDEDTHPSLLAGRGEKIKGTRASPSSRRRSSINASDMPAAGDRESGHSPSRRNQQQQQRQNQHSLPLRTNSSRTKNRERSRSEGKKSPRTPFQPRLTGKGRRAISKVAAPDFLVGWKHRQDQKTDHRRTESVLKEVAECQEAPGITQRSRLLAAKANARDGLSGLTPLEAMLERDRLRKLAGWERRQMQEAEANLFHPRITLYAATLGERATFTDAKGKEIRRSSSAYGRGDYYDDHDDEEDEEEEFYGNEGIGEGTTRNRTPYGTSFSVASATRHQRARMPVTERLYADAFAQEERKTARLRQMQEIEEAARRKAPKGYASADGHDGIEYQAEEAAAEHRRKVPIEESLLDRHTRLRAAQEEKLAQMRQAEAMLRQPAINPVSEAITARLDHTSADRLTSGHRSIFERPRTVLSSDLEAQESAKGGAAGKNRVLSREEERQFSLRLAAYEEKRREKIKQLEASREGEELAECTFAPAVVGFGGSYRTSSESRNRLREEGGEGEGQGEGRREATVTNTMHAANYDSRAASSSSPTNRQFDVEGLGRRSSPHQSYNNNSSTIIHSNQQGGKGLSGPVAVRNGPVEERTQQWLQRREAKLEAMREEAAARKQRELEELNLPPRPTQRSASSAGSRSSSVASATTIYADNRPWGTDTHIQRQAASRRLREEKEERLSGRPKPSALRPQHSTTNSVARGGERSGGTHHMLYGGGNEGTIARGPSSRANSPSIDRRVGGGGGIEGAGARGSSERSTSIASASASPHQRGASDGRYMYPATAVTRPASLDPPVAPADVRQLLGLDKEDLSYMRLNPSPEALRDQQRAYERRVAGIESPVRDQYIARHSTGVLIPPSLW